MNITKFMNITKEKLKLFQVISEIIIPELSFANQKIFLVFKFPEFIETIL